MKVSLVVVKGKPVGMEIPIKSPQFFIGRDKRCHLRPNNELVSKVHCALKVTDAQIELFDMQSTNGTFINERRVQGSVKVAHGDEVRVGALTFQIRVDSMVDGGALWAADQPEENDDHFHDAIADLLSASPQTNGAIVGEPTVMEPGLDNTAMDLRMDGETREMLANQVPDSDKESNAESKADKAKKQMGDTAAAASQLLSQYLVRKRTN